MPLAREFSDVFVLLRPARHRSPDGSVKCVRTEALARPELTRGAWSDPSHHGDQGECSSTSRDGLGSAIVKAKRLTQQVIRQSKWTNAELEGTGSETHDDLRRPECTESLSRSNGTGCHL